MKTGAMTPKYFDYLHEYGGYLTDRFGISCEGEGLEADIAYYRRRQKNTNRYWTAAVYIRRLLEQIVDAYLGSYDYGKMLGSKVQAGINDGLIPRPLGYKMRELNRLVREGAHAGEYTQDELEAALIRLDEIFRAILKSEGKPITGNTVPSSADEVLIAYSGSIEEKAIQAALLTGNKQLVEESRIANERAAAAEREALAARNREEKAVRENEQLRLELESAMQTIGMQRATINEKTAAYDSVSHEAEMMKSPASELSADAGAKAAKLLQLQKESDVRLAQAKETRRAKEAALEEAAYRVNEYEEYLDGILNEHDFISALLAKRGKATDEQRRIVNYPLGQTHKSKVLKVTGKAGTGKTLCLLATTINYLEPHGQRSMYYDDQTQERRALFICYNKDLASYAKGLIEGFPGIEGSLEVASYDQYLNQLVRSRPVKGYEHLSEYAKDVRFQCVTDSYGKRHYWNLLVDEEQKRGYVREAIEEILSYYQTIGRQDCCNSPFLDRRNEANVIWMLEEIEWLEGRYHDINEGEKLYPTADRVGRGNSRRLMKNSADRTSVINVWKAYCKILKEHRLYTFQQIVTTLLRSKQLPTYDIVAIDEAQDLNMLHIELFLRLKAKNGYLLIAGDEGQKVYPRDFSWSQIDKSIRPVTRMLTANKRNPEEIRLFSERLEDGAQLVRRVPWANKGVVQVWRGPKEGVVSYIKQLAERKEETTVLVASDTRKWERLLQAAGVVTETRFDNTDEDRLIHMSNGGVRPGVYCFVQLRTKGLEFDNVVIDYTHEIDKFDEQRERRIRYMQFTRARKTLLIRYENEVPKLLQEFYQDYLPSE